MNLLRKTVTRRAALGASAAGLALVALGWWKRSSAPAAVSPWAAASEASAPTATIGAASVAPETAAAPSADGAASHTTAGARPVPRPVPPAGGAGLFDVDPDQSTVNQDPHVEVTGDIAALPLDMEF